MIFGFTKETRAWSCCCWSFSVIVGLFIVGWLLVLIVAATICWFHFLMVIARPWPTETRDHGFKFMNRIWIDVFFSFKKSLVYIYFSKIKTPKEMSTTNCNTHVLTGHPKGGPSPPPPSQYIRRLNREDCTHPVTEVRTESQLNFIQSMRRRTGEQIIASELCTSGLTKSQEDLWAAAESILLWDQNHDKNRTSVSIGLTHNSVAFLHFLCLIQ